MFLHFSCLQIPGCTLSSHRGNSLLTSCRVHRDTPHSYPLKPHRRETGEGQEGRGEESLWERLSRTLLWKLHTSAERGTPRFTIRVQGFARNLLTRRLGVRVPAVVSSVRLDAAALGTLVHHLSWFELQAFDEFFGSVSFRHGSLGEAGEERNCSICYNGCHLINSYSLI